MKEFKGTKGEWKLIGVGSFAHPRGGSIVDDKGITICSLFFGANIFKSPEGRLPQEIIYNAQLIANAPKMLELLQKLHTLKHVKEMDGKTPYYLEEQPKAWQEVEQLLNKILD